MRDVGAAPPPRPRPAPCPGRSRHRPRGRHRAPPPPADPHGVHRQPGPRAADPAVHGQAPRGDPRPRGRGRRRPTEMRERIARIEVETGHLAQMVNEMLDLARIEGGSLLRLGRRRGPGPARGHLGRAAAPVRGTQRRQLAIDFEPGLPTIRGDEARLGQVVVNLVHNAVKFSPDGGEVRVAGRRAGRGRVAVSVTDHGVGIAGRTGRASSSASTRRTGRACAGAAPAWASQSPATSWRGTAGGSASNPWRAPARPSP